LSSSLTSLVSSVATPAPVPRRRRRRTKLQRRQTRLGWLLLVPALAVVAFVAVYPLGKTVYQSFTNQEFLGLQKTKWIGLDNYHQLIHDTVFKDTVVLTIKFTLITVGFEFVLGLIVALVVNSKFRGRGAMRAIMLVPWAIPTVVAAKMWQWMLDDHTYGVINDLGIKTHILSHPHAWLAQTSTLLASACAVDIWKTTPFVALLLLAGLQVIPTDLYEAASVDGANKLQQFWRITLPLLRPAILVTLIFRTLDALRVFDVFQVLFGYRLGSQTMAVYNQSTITQDNHVGYGSAMSVAIFLIISLFVVIYVTIVRVTDE
jgi:trehalose/maltose transport system permease protein